MVALLRFNLVSKAQRKNFSSTDLNQPFIPPSHHVHEYIIHSAERYFLVFTISFLILLATIQFRITDLIFLISSFILAEVSHFTVKPAIGGFLAGAIAYFTGVSAVFPGEIYALSSGILFQSIASQCLPLWDLAGQTKIGFRISSIALVSLYIAACSIAIVV